MKHRRKKNRRINPVPCFLAKILLFLCDACRIRKHEENVRTKKSGMSSFQGGSQLVLLQESRLSPVNAMVFLKKI